MILTVITPTTSAEHAIAWLEITTPAGTFTIYRGHAPMIVPITPFTQLIFKLKTGKQQTVTVQQGVAHITRETVEALVTPVE